MPMAFREIALRLGASLLRVGAALALVALLGVAVLLALTTMPLRSHEGPLPPLGDEDRALAARLRRHVQAIASEEHNLHAPAALEQAARYLEAELSSYGYHVERQEFEASRRTVRNLQVTMPSAANPGQCVVVVGAHYDSAQHTPGANDNGSGSAALLELARSLKKQPGALARCDVQMVLYTNEEPPYFKTRLMGSYVHARSLKTSAVPVVAMLSLETMGYFSDVPGSQRYPWPLNLLYPTQGNFIAFVGTPRDLLLVRSVVKTFRGHAAFPSEGIAAPRFIPGVDYSDHAAYLDEGYPALMVTDTAPYRYPHYHTRLDTPDKVDYDKLARVVQGVEQVVMELARREVSPAF